MHSGASSALEFDGFDDLAIEGCTGWTGAGVAPEVRFRYRANNLGPEALTDCVLNETNLVPLSGVSVPLTYAPSDDVVADSISFAGSRVETADVSRAVPVETLALEPADSVRVERTYTGVLKADRASELGFELAGKLRRILVDEGDRVAAGQLLAELDNDILMARKEQLQAERVQAAAVLAETGDPAAQPVVILLTDGLQSGPIEPVTGYTWMWS
mgnify:CR=1 FL=1